MGVTPSDDKLGFMLPAAGAAIGTVLLASSLGAPLPQPPPGVLVLGLAAVPAALLASRLRRKNRDYAVYEVRGRGGLTQRQLTAKLRLLAELAKTIGRSYGVMSIVNTCDRRGCSLYIVIPRDDKLEAIIRGVFADVELRRLDAKLEELVRRGGGSAEPLLADNIPGFGEEQAATRGEILIGLRVADSTPIYAEVEEFWRHTGVFGTTGSGKTTTTSILVAQLSKHVRVIVFDWHGEYPHTLSKLDAEYVEIDPIPMPLIPDDLDIEITVNILEDAFDLTRHQSMLLYQALKSMRKRDALPPDLDEFTESLLTTLEVQQSTPSRAEFEIRAALERRLRGLVTGEGKKYFRVRGVVELPDANLVVLRVDKILLMALRRIYVRMLLAYLYYSALTTGKKLDTILVLEEAHNIASTDTRTIPSILAEARKRHLGLMIVTQSPSSLHPSVLKNTNIRIVHTLKSAQDITVVAKSMSLTPEQRSMLPRLPVGTAIVDTPQLERPQLVRIPLEQFTS